MNIYLNGAPREVPDGATVAQAIEELAPGPRRGIAVAVDGEVVPRAAWDETPVRSGARLEVVQAVQGG